MKNISSIQLISSGEKPDDHITTIESFCKQGGDWVQLRLKNTSKDVIISTAEKVKSICQYYRATFIINDHIDICEKLNLDGVHLGQNDDSILEAKNRLNNKIIGGTANTLEECKKLVNEGIDYIGLGPFRFTKTKKKLSPILGLEGYKSILEKLTEQDYIIPVVAIGGIQKEDLKPLMKTGIRGIAAASLLSKANFADIKAQLK